MDYYGGNGPSEASRAGAEHSPWMIFTRAYKDFHGSRNLKMISPLFEAWKAKNLNNHDEVFIYPEDLGPPIVKPPPKKRGRPLGSKMIKPPKPAPRKIVIVRSDEPRRVSFEEFKDDNHPFFALPEQVPIVDFSLPPRVPQLRNPDALVSRPRGRPRKEKPIEDKPKKPRGRPRKDGSGLSWNDVTSIFTGRDKYPPQVRKFIEERGNEMIVSFRVGKKPINELLSKLGNFVTSGKLKEEVNKYGFDKLFHLWLEFGLESGRTFRTEKDEVIKIGPAKPEPDAEFMDVRTHPISVSQFFEVPLKHLGKTLLRYTADKYNCQHYVVTLLQYADALTPSAEKFIDQKVTDILSDPSFTLHKSVVRFLSDLGASWNVIREGAGGKTPRLSRY